MISTPTLHWTRFLIFRHENKIDWNKFTICISKTWPPISSCQNYTARLYERIFGLCVVIDRVISRMALKFTHFCRTNPDIHCLNCDGESRQSIPVFRNPKAVRGPTGSRPSVYNVSAKLTPLTWRQSQCSGRHRPAPPAGQSATGDGENSANMLQ